MSSDIFIFRRIEKKYMLTDGQYEALLSLIGNYLTPDKHGKSTVNSLYLDTPDFRLIRASIDAKNDSAAYKEKLRLRSYGTARTDTSVFLELKKKYKGVVYKRRVSMPLWRAENYIFRGIVPDTLTSSQIMRELDYAMEFYKHPLPAMLLCYEREAFFVNELPALRLTFDRRVRYRREELSLTAGSHGKEIIPEDCVLLEIKTDGAMPLWLSAALDRCRIFPVSFSKYGTAYKDFLAPTLKDPQNNNIFFKGDNSHARSFSLNN